MGELNPREGKKGLFSSAEETANSSARADRTEIDAAWRRFEELARASKVRVFALAEPLATANETAFLAQARAGNRNQPVTGLLFEEMIETSVGFAVRSLGRSAQMMNEIVEETRRDQIEFEIRSRQIDRTLERAQEILDGMIEASK
jgi:hypothetical protein